MDLVKKQIKDLFDEIGEGDVHGYKHALNVYNHAMQGLREISYKKKLHTEQQMAVIYAALLHDVDDKKIFPKSENHQNARRILSSIDFSDIELVITMIELVSFSKNRNHGAVLDIRGIRGRSCIHHEHPSWMYIPRDADRIEALGKMGIVRCISYGVEVKRPLYLAETPKLKTRKELYACSAKYLFQDKIPESSIDYFIYGLIPRRIMASQCRYFEILADDMIKPIEDFCLLYGSQGYISSGNLAEIAGSNQELLSLLKSHNLV